MTTLSPWSVLVFTVSIALASFAGFKAGERSINPGAIVESTSKGREVPRTPPTEVPSGELNSRTEVESDEETQADGDLGSVQTNGPCKLVLVVRTDLGMTKGKIAAQCGWFLLSIEERHATLSCYKSIQKANPKLLQHWEWTGQAKIALQAKGEEDLLLLQATAQSLSLVARVIHDAGRTQIQAGSATVLGIGPGPIKLVDQVTGHLKLL